MDSVVQPCSWKSAASLRKRRVWAVDFDGFGEGTDYDRELSGTAGGARRAFPLRSRGWSPASAATLCPCKGRRSSGTGSAGYAAVRPATSPSKIREEGRAHAAMSTRQQQSAAIMVPQVLWHWVSRKSDAHADGHAHAAMSGTASNPTRRTPSKRRGRPSGSRLETRIMLLWHWVLRG